MLLDVTVKPGRKHSKIEWSNNLLTVWLSAPAKNGKANKQLIGILAKFFDTNKSSVQIKSGHTNSIKLIMINQCKNIIQKNLKHVEKEEQTRIF